MRPPVLERESLTLYETPDPDAVARVSNHPDVWPSQKQMYDAYHDLVASSNDGCVSIDYFRRQFGRFYVVNSGVMSATPMWSSARATLFQKTDIDIDGVQMHPNLLLYEMEKLSHKDPNCPPFDALRAMCADREAIFDKCEIEDDWLRQYNEVNKSFMTKKDVFKLLATIIIFGGREQTWLAQLVPASEVIDDENAKRLYAEEWKPTYTLGAEMRAYMTQIPELARYMMLQSDYDEIREWVRTDKEEKKAYDSNRFPGQFLAILLQNIEADLLLRIMKHFSSVGLHPTVYAYDGFQIAKPTDETQKKVLADALRHVSEFRPHATFIVKPFRTAINVEGVAPRSIEWDTDAFHDILESAKTPEEQSLVYYKQKAYWEMTHFYIMRQTAIGCVTTHGHYKGIISFSPDKAASNYENLYTLVRNPGGEKLIEKGAPAYVPVPFFSGGRGVWRKDRTRRTVQSIELFPQPGGMKCPPGCYNMWQGWEIEHTPYDPDIDISVMLDHYVELIPDKPCREYLLDWIAHKVQLPGLKLRTCPILYGKQGTGKSAIFEKPFHHWLGSFHYKMSDSVDDIVSRFAENSQYLLFVLNEATMKDNMKHADALKNAVTADTHNQEKKSVQKEFNLNNVTDYCMTTNNPNCVKVEGTEDRRWFIVATSGKYANKEPSTLGYFHRLHAALDSKPHQRALFEWFRRRDISAFNPRKYPSSNLRAAMIQSSERPEMTWLKSWLAESKTNKEIITKPTLFRLYQKFIPENGFSYSLNKNGFKAFMIMIEGIDSEARTGKARGYRITDWQAAANYVGLDGDAEGDK